MNWVRNSSPQQLGQDAQPEANDQSMILWGLLFLIGASWLAWIAKAKDKGRIWK